MTRDEELRRELRIAYFSMACAGLTALVWFALFIVFLVLLIQAA